jgi:RNA-directed DNA polymerase
MMHGREKSDLVVVAVKSTNKAELSAAEPAEPRTGTKGNAGQQSTLRAQDRASVSQALSRVRKAAKQRKKEKFTTLFHHLDCSFALGSDRKPHQEAPDRVASDLSRIHLDRR